MFDKAKRDKVRLRDDGAGSENSKIVEHIINNALWIRSEVSSFKSNI